MKVRVNGAEHEVPAETTLADLVEELGLAGRRLAIELNQDIVRKDHWQTTRLGDRDTVEIVHFVGGG